MKYQKVVTFPPYELLSSKKVPVPNTKERKLTPPVVSVSLERGGILYAQFLHSNVVKFQIYYVKMK